MSENFLDIEEAVKVWAHREYDKTATRKQRWLKNKEIKTGTKIIQILIDWANVKFESDTSWSWISDLGQGSNTESCNESNDNTAVIQSLLPAHTFRTISLNKPSASVLFQTSFTNNTESTQRYSMKTEKATRSSMVTEIETGITKGVDMSLKLQTPCEIFEANVGYKREFSLNKIEGETFEEEVSWGVEAEIEVKAGHVAEACLVIEEKKQNGNFQLTTKMSGMVYVTFTNLRDNNSFVKCSGHDIASIVREYLALMNRKGKNLGAVVTIDSDDVVVARTTGSCKFRYGVKQEVILNQMSIKINPL